LRDQLPDHWKTAIRKLMLGFDAWVDSSLFSSGRGLRELYERYATFMDRFYAAG
jgi:penicillin-binding protein 1A